MLPNTSLNKLLATALILLAHVTAFAQNSPGAAAAGMGGSAIVREDAWSAFHNQAGLVYLSGISAGLYYENRFTIKELGDKGVVVALPIRNSAFSITYRSFGYSAYSDSRAGLAYALKLSDIFSFGLQFNYHTIRIADNYGSRSNISFDAGFLYRMTTKLSLAAHVSNPSRARIADFNDERYPSVIRVGAGYKFSERVRLSAEAKKPDNAIIGLHAGIEYRIVKEIALRAGFNTNNTFSFGFGWLVKALEIDAAAGFNNVLGFTPQLSLTYTGAKK